MGRGYKENRGMSSGLTSLAFLDYYTPTDSHRSGNSPLILGPAGNRISACGNSSNSKNQEVIPHE